VNQRGRTLWQNRRGEDTSIVPEKLIYLILVAVAIVALFSIIYVIIKKFG
jgi:cell division protein FtsL